MSRGTDTAIRVAGRVTLASASDALCVEGPQKCIRPVIGRILRVARGAGDGARGVGRRGKHAAARHGTGATAAASPAPDLGPTDREAGVSRLVSSVFERSHYRRAPVNDPVSAIILDRYVQSLDGNRSYFLQADIDEFERYRYQLDDAVARPARPGVRDLQPLPAA